MGLNNFAGPPGQTPPVPPAPPGAGLPTGPVITAPVTDSSVDPMELLVDYNAKFANAGMILHRDAVIRQTIATLIAKNKPNALLIGPAGVGKTKIAETVAYLLANNDPIIPDKLIGYTVYELPLSNIVAGSSFVGQVEGKIKAVVEFLSDKASKAIVFIDEIHQLVGDSPSYEKIAQIMKPALARGDIITIGATTSQEAGRLMDDPALNRRFSRVIVDELSQEQTLDVLRNAVDGFVAHYDSMVSIPDEILPTVVSMADEYRAAGNHRPDTALTLLDKALGEAVVARKVAYIKAATDPALQQALASVPVIVLNRNMLKQTALRMMTGNAKKQDFDPNEMKSALSEIHGQDHVIEEMLRLLNRYTMDIFPRTKPLTVLFAGNSGTGKTEISKIVARTLTGMEPIILNMTEYNSSASINRIIGSPAGYVGSDSNRELPFDILESNPYQVILLDEFEKCDKAVQRLFMSAFDEGYIKTNRGKTVDFSRCIMIATTNAAHERNSVPLGFNSQQKNKDRTISDLSGWFDTALLNRFRSIITFNPLEKDVYRTILSGRYEKEVARIKQSHPHLPLPDIMPSNELEQLVADTYVAAFGARPAAEAVQGYIESKL